MRTKSTNKFEKTKPRDVNSPMARLYSNENFPLPAVEELRRFGHDVVTIQETGKAGISVSDDLVLDYAVADDRAVLSLNRKHFVRLHRQKPHHAGIVVCSFDADFTGLAHRIHGEISARASLRGVLVRVNRPPSKS
jgi:hypothetical protein